MAAYSAEGHAADQLTPSGGRTLLLGCLFDFSADSINAEVGSCVEGRRDSRHWPCDDRSSSRARQLIHCNLVLKRQGLER